MSFAFKKNSSFKKRANLPYNRKGHIAQYTKDGGRKAQEKGGSDAGTFSKPSNRFKSRNNVPTMDQIQSGKKSLFYWILRTRLEWTKKYQTKVLSFTKSCSSEQVAGAVQCSKN